MPVRVIVGAGTAAAVFLRTVAGDGYTNVVVGSDGLWAQLPDHPMGQPEHLLHLPGQPVPPYRTASGSTEEGLQKFLTSQTYQHVVAGMVSRHSFAFMRGDTVDKIEKNGDSRLKVRVKDRLILLADQVILATGIGPQQKPPRIEGTPREDLGFTPILEGVEFLALRGEQEPVIDRGVYGGSATAAWVTAVAYSTSPRLCWFARPGGSEFRGSDLPGVRNAKILQDTLAHGLRKLEEIEKIVVAGEKLKLFIKDKDYYYVADQFIYALGGDTRASPLGSIQSMLARELYEDLQPFKDINGALGTVNEGVLAWATSTKSVMIVGAATYNFAKPHKVGAPMSDLPWNAQVPDGIAMITASVSALNTFIPIKQKATKPLDWEEGDWLDVEITENTTNINLADRNQLAVLFTLMFDEWPASSVNTLVERVIAWRSTTSTSKDSYQVFGITPSEFLVLVRTHGPRELSEEELEERFRLVGVEFKRER